MKDQLKLAGSVAVVDDDESIRDLLSLRLSSWGIAPSLFASAESYLASLAEGARFDATMIDLTMPGMSGLQAIAKIRESPQGLAPILVISGVADGKVVEAAARQRINGYVLKPFDFVAMARLLKNALGSEVPLDQLRDMLRRAHLHDPSLIASLDVKAFETGWTAFPVNQEGGPLCLLVRSKTSAKSLLQASDGEIAKHCILATKQNGKWLSLRIGRVKPAAGDDLDQLLAAI